MNLIEKVITISAALIALGLILTNGKNDATIVGSLSGGYDSAVKTLQMR